MSNPIEFPRSGDRNPISDAAHRVAADIHQNLMGELHAVAPVDFQESVEVQGERYPHLLFGELAMHIAEVDLPADATGR